jgi:hypothetical protein
MASLNKVFGLSEQGLLNQQGLGYRWEALSKEVSINI